MTVTKPIDGNDPQDVQAIERARRLDAAAGCEFLDDRIRFEVDSVIVIESSQSTETRSRITTQ